MAKNTTCIIRKANESDAKAIAEVHVLSWQKIYRGFIPDNFLNTLSIPERQQQWHDLIIQDVIIFVVEVDEQIVGFTSICGFRDSEADSLQGEISAIYLHPDYWRQGFGKKLCQVAIDELKRIGFNEIQLWVLKDNIQAQKFYESMGFNATHTTKTEEWCDDVVLPEILFCKQLH